jgi:hypothetical protein
MIQLKPITHLTDEEHAEAARLLNEVEAHLKQVASIVRRAPYTDQALRVSKAVQEVLIDPLREGWSGDKWDRDGNPYQSHGYGVSNYKRFIDKIAAG